VTAERRIELKIGIHIGDVVHRDGDVYGDGVNIASRIEPLAGAGGICVSMDVERQIRNAVETRLEKLAPTELKNISVPMELFRIVLPWEKQVPRPAIRPTRATRQSRLWIWFAASTALLLVIGLAAFFIIRPRSQKVSSQAPATIAIPEKSIAVLPFDNLSDDKSNAYFAEGMQDEILTRLSKIAALKVISRSSTMKYKSVPDNLREVGKQLGVANILEGSVQKIANAVHVNVQLIRVATDEHLWAESYNRKLDDVFAVEGEVATTIAEQLNTKLSGAEQKAVTDRPTQNAAAYDAYLRGITREHDEYSVTALREVADDYSEAVRLDPNFALAWARLATVRSFLYFNQLDLGTNTPAVIKEAADRAMALAPEAGESWIAQGSYYYRVLLHYEDALAAYQEAQKRMPNSAFVYQHEGFVQRRLGGWQDAEASFKKALELDPRNVTLLGEVATDFYNFLRRFDDAIRLADRALEIAPDSVEMRARKVDVLQDAGRLAEAAEELKRIPSSSTQPFVLTARIKQASCERRPEDGIKVEELAWNTLPPDRQPESDLLLVLINGAYCYLDAGRTDEARSIFLRILEQLKPDSAFNKFQPFLLSAIYAGLGEKEKALQEAHRAIEEWRDDAISRATAEVDLALIQARLGDKDAALAALPHLLQVPAGLTIANLKYNPAWDSLRDDPRFQKLLTMPEHVGP
jgi:TolB-like protein